MSRHEAATQQFVRRCSRLLLERIACPRLYTKCARERIPVRVGCNPLHGPPSLNLAQHLGDAVCERWLHLIYTSSRHSVPPNYLDRQQYAAHGACFRRFHAKRAKL